MPRLSSPALSPPPAPDVREHPVVVVEPIPVHKGADLLGRAGATRRHFQTGRQFVCRKAPNAFLAQETATLFCPATFALFPGACGLHPALQESHSIHAMPVVRYSDQTARFRDRLELDRDLRGVGIMSVLDQFDDRDDFIADQLGPD